MELMSDEKKTKPERKKKAKVSFEDALSQLEEVVIRMESGKVP